VDNVSNYMFRHCRRVRRSSSWESEALVKRWWTIGGMFPWSYVATHDRGTIQLMFPRSYVATHDRGTIQLMFPQSYVATHDRGNIEHVHNAIVGTLNTYTTRLWQIT
jgi:hypothetical protein